MPVALGSRSYDIVIGPGLIGTDRRGGEAAGAVRPLCRRHGRNCRDAASAVAGVRVCGGGHGARRDRPPAGRGIQELYPIGTIMRCAARPEAGARRHRHRAGRRRDRRSRRICGQHPETRRAAGADPDDAARPGRFLDRRQDRDQHAARKKPDRHLPPAEPRADRHRRAGHAGRARVPLGLCRNGEIRLARRCRLLRLAGDAIGQACSRATSRRACMPSR